jgi:hypothetical protein
MGALKLPFPLVIYEGNIKVLYGFIAHNFYIIVYSLLDIELTHKTQTVCSHHNKYHT